MWFIWLPNYINWSILILISFFSFVPGSVLCSVGSDMYSSMLLTNKTGSCIQTGNCWYLQQSYTYS